MHSTLIRLLSMALLLALPAGAHARTDPPSAPEGKAPNRQTESFWFGHPGKASDVTRTIRITATEYRFQPAVLNV